MAASSEPNAPQAKKTRRGEGRARQRLERAKDAGQEHPGRWRERLGETKLPRPNGPLIWFHVKNSEAARPYFALIERLRLERDELNFLITTSFSDLGDLLLGQLPDRCLHQHLPYEDKAIVIRFLDHWRPDCCIWGETTLPAIFIEQISGQRIPMFLIDADLPDERQQKLRWFPRNARKLLGKFEHIIAVNGRTAHNMKRLGVSGDQVEVLGRLEEAAPPLDFVQSDRDTIALSLASRPVWLASGITSSEEPAILAAHKQVLRYAHRLLLILVPDDPARGPELATQLEQEDWLVALRSDNQELEPDTQIFIADRACELGLWIRLSPITFFGRSMAPSDQNAYDPFQATLLGSAVLHGPHMGAFSSAYARLHRAGAALLVNEKGALARELEMLLAPDKAAEMARAAWEVSTRGAEVSDRICALIFDALDARGV